MAEQLEAKRIKQEGERLRNKNQISWQKTVEKAWSAYKASMLQWKLDPPQDQEPNDGEWVFGPPGPGKLGSPEAVEVPQEFKGQFPTSLTLTKGIINRLNAQDIPDGFIQMLKQQFMMTWIVPIRLCFMWQQFKSYRTVQVKHSLLVSVMQIPSAAKTIHEVVFSGTSFSEAAQRLTVSLHREVTSMEVVNLVDSRSIKTLLPFLEIWAVSSIVGGEKTPGFKDHLRAAQLTAIRHNVDFIAYGMDTRTLQKTFEQAIEIGNTVGTQGAKWSSQRRQLPLPVRRNRPGAAEAELKQREGEVMQEAPPQNQARPTAILDIRPTVPSRPNPPLQPTPFNPPPMKPEPPQDSPDDASQEEPPPMRDSGNPFSPTGAFVSGGTTSTSPVSVSPTPVIRRAWQPSKPAARAETPGRAERKDPDQEIPKYGTEFTEMGKKFIIKSNHIKNMRLVNIRDIARLYQGQDREIYSKEGKLTTDPRPDAVIFKKMQGTDVVSVTIQE
jgi:hypothetical protein